MNPGSTRGSLSDSRRVVDQKREGHVNSIAQPQLHYPDPQFANAYRLDCGVLVRADIADPAFDYSDGDEVETRLLRIIRAADDRSVFSAALRDGMTDWPSRYHLNSRRPNLLRPFAGRLAGQHVLEVGAGCGAITRYLGELASGPAGGSIVALESSRRRAGITRLRTEELAAVQVVCDDVFRFAPDRLFDVAVVVGVLEYARLFYTGPGNAEQALLDRLAGLLRPGGLLLLAIENQLGLKYLAGVPEDHLGQPYQGVEDRYGARTAVTFGRKELGGLLQRAGFASPRSYLPFPDYKLPSVIISPRGAAEPGFLAGCLAAEAVATSEYTRFSLQSAWPVVDKNGLLEDLANSFLIAAHSAGPAAIEADPGVLAWYYNTDRGGLAFKKETRFVADAESGIQVVREALLPLAAPPDVPIGCHQVTETYLAHATWWFRLIAVIGRRGWTLAELGDWAQVWLDAFLARAGGGPLVADRLVSGSLVDATPFNLIVTPDGTPVFIDQEWQVKPELPLGFIAARSLRDSMHRIVHVARPADPELFSEDRIVQAVLARLGVVLTPSDLERFAEIEAVFQAWTAGAVLPAEGYSPLGLHRGAIKWHAPGLSPDDETAIEEDRRQLAASRDESARLGAQLAAQESREAEQVSALRAELAGQASRDAGQLAALQVELAALRAQLTAQEEREAADLAGLRVQLTAREEHEAAALGSLQAEAQRTLAAANERWRESEERYRLIRDSRSWQMTAPVRAVGNGLPAGLRRRTVQVGKLVWWCATLQIVSRFRDWRRLRRSRGATSGPWPGDAE
jgi:SAM-dependent methyltransferase